MLREAKRPSQDYHCPPCTAHVCLRRPFSLPSSFRSAPPCPRSLCSCPWSGTEPPMPRLLERAGAEAKDRAGRPRRPQPGWPRRPQPGCAGAQGGQAPPPSAGPCRSAARSRSPAPGGSSGPRLAAPLSLLLARRCRLFCKGALHLIFQPFCENQCCDKEGRNRPFSPGLRLNCPCAGNRTGPCSRSLRVMLEPDVSLQCDMVREKIKIPLGKDAQLQAETLRSSLLVNGPCRINVSGSQAWFPLWGPREQRLPWRERGSGAAGPISPRLCLPGTYGRFNRWI